MNKILIATTNENKVNRIKKLLSELDYEILSLKEIKKEIPEAKETANTPEGIAIEKALHYVNYLPENTLVLTQDDTIKLKGISEEDDPKLSIKEPVRKKYGKFTDELAATYYSELATKYGGTIPVTFNYGHAIAIKTKADRNITKVIGASSKLEVRLVNNIHKLETSSGYFLEALIEANINGNWIPYNDLDEKTLIQLDNDLYNSITYLLENIK